MAGRVWDLEQRGWLQGGLFGELLEAHRLHGIPLPDTALDKEEYAGEVNKAIFRAAVQAVREATSNSTKLLILRHHERYGSDMNSWHNLDEIKLVARAKLSCLAEFGADWGRAETCECGARDTFLHAAGIGLDAGCEKFRVTRESYPDRARDDAALLNFTKEVLRIKATVNINRGAGG